jgi:hypothetical protein
MQHSSLWRTAWRTLSLLMIGAVLATAAGIATGAPPALALPEANAAAAPQQVFERGPVYLPIIIREPPPVIPKPPEIRPNLGIALRSSPSHSVKAGQQVAITVQVDNTGNGDASGAKVRIDYDRSKVEPLNSSFENNKGDWVSSVDDYRAIVEFGKIHAGERRSGKVIFRVRSLSAGASIKLAGSYSCGDGSSGLCYTNRIALSVASSTQGNSSGHYTLAVSPDRAPPGTTHHFSSDVFQPGEEVTTWLNVPGGVRSLDMRAMADSLGRVHFSYNSSTLDVGDYALVAYGQSSHITAVGPFRVQGPQGLASAHAQAYRSGAVYPSTADAAPAGPAADTAAAPQQEPANGGISGRVTAADTGAGLADVLVLVRNAAGELLESATTEADGTYYVFYGLATGAYTVEFVTASVNTTTASYAGGMLSGVQVTEPNVTRNVNAVLAKAAAIGGRVTAADGGAALEGVPVFVYDSAQRLSGIDVTDTAGNYRVGGLAAGSYTVWFSPSLALDGYALGYNDAAFSGNPVSITAPAGRTDVNQALTRDTTENRISGHVTASDGGAGVPGVPVLVTDADDSFAAIAETDESGRYTTDNLDLGTYKVYFLPEFSAVPTTTAYLNAAYTANPVDLTAGGGKANVDATISKGGRISGKVTAADTGEALEDVLVAVYDASSTLTALGLSDEDGNYSTSGLASGNYKVEFFTGFSTVMTTTHYVGEFYNDKRTLFSATPVDVTAPGTTQNIDAALVRGGELSGTVTAADTDQPLAGVFVLVLDVTQNFAAIAVTDESGNYSVPNLGSGSYVVAFDTIFSSNPAATPYLDSFYSGASSITDATPVLVIAPNATAGIDEALERGGQISGHVTAADTGAGLRGVFVEIFDSTDTLVSATVTDADGQYTIPGLAAGAYRVKFETGLAVDTTTGEYASEYYNDKADLASADVVTVAVPAGAPNIDAVLARVP